jgi:hypothetical protein
LTSGLFFRDWQAIRAPGISLLDCFRLMVVTAHLMTDLFRVHPELTASRKNTIVALPLKKCGIGSSNKETIYDERNRYR